MKGNVRGRVLMRLLKELPPGIQLMKCDDDARGLADALDDEEDGPAYLAWLRELETRLGPSQEPGFDLSKLPDPPPVPVVRPRPRWLVSYYDEYGEMYEDTEVDLAEDPDLVRALLLAKNRLAAGRKLR